MPSLTRPTWTEQSNQKSMVTSAEVPAAAQERMP